MKEIIRDQMLEVAGSSFGIEIQEWHCAVKYMCFAGSLGRYVDVTIA